MVLHQDVYNRKHKALKTSAKESSVEALYHSTLSGYAPDIKALLGDGELRRNEDGLAVNKPPTFLTAPHAMLARTFALPGMLEIQSAFVAFGVTPLTPDNL